jgi:hypothetical protein
VLCIIVLVEVCLQNMPYCSLLSVCFVVMYRKCSFLFIYVSIVNFS